MMQEKNAEASGAPAGQTRKTETDHPLKIKSVSSHHQKKGKNRDHHQQILDESAEWKDRCLRIAAEFDNYRKRTEKETQQTGLLSNAEWLKKLLPILDDFERSLKFSSEKNPGDFRNGIEHIFRKLQSLLQSSGLEVMEAAGTPFDVDRHDAMLLLEKEGTPPGTVVEELEKGYLLRGKVLRHAKVAVSK
jgi:molecular chaperone GrpE